MKPLRLVLQAFGPFAQTHTVDFSRLEGALFLIHGSTGSGKTTLLDALCFALYGDTSGGERDPRAMRSDHAPPSLETEITLDFSLGDECLRVVRKPAQRRAKRRGEGDTEVPASARLDRLVGTQWKNVATQPGRVTSEIRNRLGFDSAQFRQVIVLPQGRFRELLSARSDEREAILQTLFRTEAFRRLGEELKRQARELESHVGRIRVQCDTLLQQAGQADREALEAFREACRVELETLRGQEATRRQNDRVARDALERGRSAAIALQELADAAAADERLRALEPQIEEKRTVLARGRQAERVLVVDRQLRVAKQAHEQALLRAVAARTAVAEAAQAHERTRLRLQSEQGREVEREACIRKLSELEALVEQVERLARTRSQRDAEGETQRRLRQDVERRIQELQQRQADLVARDARAAGLRETVATRELLAHRLELARTQARQLERLAAARDAVAIAERDVEAARGGVREAEAHLHACRETLEMREGDWLSGQARLLATQLVPGEACPVCGATEHPLPAHGDVDSPSGAGEDRVKAAREAVRAASSLRDTALARCHALETGLAQRRATVSELDGLLRGVENASLGSAGCAALEQALEGAEAAARELAGITREQEAQRLRVGELERAVRQQETEAARMDARIAALDAEIALYRDSVPEALRDPQVLRKEIAGLVERREALESALRQAREEERTTTTRLAGAQAAAQSAEEEAGRAASALADAQSHFIESWMEAGFADESAYRDAVRDAAVLDTWSAELAAHERACAAARDRLARARGGADGLVAPDLEGLQHAATESASALEGLLGEIQASAARLRPLDQVLESLLQLEREAGEAGERYAVLGRLAEVAGGTNPLRMTFQRFVLATLLDEVLEAASMRLTRMSRSRFELRRVRQALDQRSAGGLDLEVFDHYTGTTRPASTLSGGEGFLAALSLALGLADVVQSRAGGIQMETLFIDEGFGTLDPESLDFAMRTLIDLQQAGRMIGVISHVAELKERMDVRLEILSGPRGSDIRVVC